MITNFSQISASQADEIGQEALLFLAQNQSFAIDFSKFSGFNLAAIRQVADTPDFYRALLEFLRRDDNQLMAFCANSNISPREVEAALHYFQSPSHFGGQAIHS